ncbi:hypothetical protein C8Q74DRAFT_1365096 [Fomes fomentarius]|nr:hypothetical protein C8Q74DRAFT_1365096 [Fomes fomentarius]
MAWLQHARIAADRRAMYDNFIQVNSVFRKAAAHLPRVLEMGSEQDSVLCAEMDAAAACFAEETFLATDSAAAPPTPDIPCRGSRQAKVSLLDRDFKRVRDTIKDCSQVTIRAFHAEVDLETWHECYRMLEAFPSLRAIHLDCTLGLWSRTTSPDASGKTVTKIEGITPIPPHPLVKSLRIERDHLREGSIAAKDLAESFPTLRELHIIGCMHLPTFLLLPPLAVETLIVEVTDAWMKRHASGWNFAKFGIGAVVRSAGALGASSSSSSGRQRDEPQAGGKKLNLLAVVFRTDARGPWSTFWWDETKKVCDQHGVRLIRERMPRS